MAVSTSEGKSIPDDIVQEILIRVPVKSVMRFRCVSKSWNLLISSKQFSRNHGVHSRNELSNINYIFSNFDGTRLGFCYLPQLLHQPIVNAFRGDLFDGFPKFIVGSCDGLICLRLNWNDFILLNPATRETYQLPKVPDFGKKLSYHNVLNVCGFGFDKSGDDYKVVIFRVGTNGVNEFLPLVCIYSMKTNHWRRIEYHRHRLYKHCQESTKFAHGRIHWIEVAVVFPNRKWRIGYLDIETEKCGIIEFPDHGNNNFYPNLEVSEGCLYILLAYKSSFNVVWSLNGYGSPVEETWTKLFTIPRSTIDLHYSKKHFSVIKKKGVILIMGFDRYLVFNMKDYSLSLPKFRGWQYEDISTAVTYVERLHSPWRR